MCQQLTSCGKCGEDFDSSREGIEVQGQTVCDHCWSLADECDKCRSLFFERNPNKAIGLCPECLNQQNKTINGNTFKATAI